MKIIDPRLQQLSKDLDDATELLDQDFAIDISACCSFGIEPEEFRLSNSNQAINDKYSKDFNPIYQYPVGYRICNVGKSTITGIVVPEYTYNPDTKLYEGVEKTVSLKPLEFLNLPTKYLVLLLLSKTQSLDVNNGKLALIKNTGIDDLDIESLMGYVKFIPSKVFSSFAESCSFYYRLGFWHISSAGIYLGLTLGREEDKKTFGYLLNPVSSTLVSTLNNVENLPESVRFIMALYNKKLV